MGNPPALNTSSTSRLVTTPMHIEAGASSSARRSTARGGRGQNCARTAVSGSVETIVSTAENPDPPSATLSPPGSHSLHLPTVPAAVDDGERARGSGSSEIGSNLKAEEFAIERPSHSTGDDMTEEETAAQNREPHGTSVTRTANLDDPVGSEALGSTRMDALAQEESRFGGADVRSDQVIELVNIVEFSSGPPSHSSNFHQSNESINMFFPSDWEDWRPQLQQEMAREELIQLWAVATQQDLRLRRPELVWENTVPEEQDRIVESVSQLVVGRDLMLFGQNGFLPRFPAQILEDDNELIEERGA